MKIRFLSRIPLVLKIENKKENLYDVSTRDETKIACSKNYTNSSSGFIFLFKKKTF